MKKLCAMIILGMISLSVSAQSIREKVDKAHKDPANKERAAKADALRFRTLIIAPEMHRDTSRVRNFSVTHRPA